MNIRTFFFVFILLAFSGVPASPVSAAGIGLWSDCQGGGPLIDVDGGLVQVHVVLADYSGLTGISFSVPVPGCGSGLTLIGETWNYPTVIGAVETGVSIGFGYCETGMICIGHLNYIGVIDSCCPIEVLPHPSSLSGKIEAIDCDLNTTYAYRTVTSLQPAGMANCGAPTVPQNPVPANGATDQPLILFLDWESRQTAGGGLGIFAGDIYFGTTPTPPQTHWLVDPPVEVGQLLPNTTYYWRVLSVDTDFGTTHGPLWSFTTETPSPTRESTWGAIKALYRD